MLEGHGFSKAKCSSTFGPTVVRVDEGAEGRCILAALECAVAAGEGVAHHQRSLEADPLMLLVPLQRRNCMGTGTSLGQSALPHHFSQLLRHWVRAACVDGLCTNFETSELGPVQTRHQSS